MCLCVSLCVSVCWQLDQEGLKRPWNLEVFDFAGRLHSVALEPGQLVFYEVGTVIYEITIILY